MENSTNQYKEKAIDLVEDGKKQVKESAGDWLKYVKTHPLQTMLFGIIGYFALKGMCK